MHSFRDLCNGKYFVIPENQRGFSWSESHVVDIFNDLTLAGTHSHYMGPIIVSRTERDDFQDDDLSTLAEYTLEDGQQRITSFFIIVNEIRKQIAKIDGDTSSPEYQDVDRIVYYNHGGKQRRLRNSNPHLDAFYDHIFLNAPVVSGLTPPMVAMSGAVDSVIQKISNLQRDELITWMRRIVNSAKFIMVDLASQNINRYLAFDAINSRGLPLSEFDKIKNFCILVDVRRSLNSKPEEEWYKAITKLQEFDVATRAKEATFISDLFAIFHGERVGQHEVHSKFVGKYHNLLIQQDKALEIDISSFIGLWEEFAISYGFVTTSDRSSHYGSECTNESGEWLDRLDNMGLPNVVRPLLSACHLRMSKPDFQSVVRASEIYTFRVYAVMKRRVDFKNSFIINLSNEVLKLNRNSTYVINRICSWLGRYGTLNDVIATLGNENAKYNHDPNVKGWSHCYYFLYEYEIFNSPRGVSPIQWENDLEGKINTQEHIMPQDHRDSGWWEAHWPDDRAADTIKHSLGNLVLTPGNSSLGRKPISEKLDDSSAAHYYNHANATNSEKLIRNYTNGKEWLINNIMKRELDMLVFASKRWNIPCCIDNSTITLSERFINILGAGTEIVIQEPNCFEEVDEAENNSDNEDVEMDQ